MHKRTALTISEEQPPFVGMGGFYLLKFPYNEMINSFRQWVYYRQPGIGEPNSWPSHKFESWAQLYRDPESTAGQCEGGTWYGCDQDKLDDIFDCDKPYIDDVLANYPGAIHGIGNEPNYAGSITPENYAYQFSKYEQYIHVDADDADPDAKLMFGGITPWDDVTYPWESWTDAFIVALNILGTPFPDIWDIHPYVNAWPDGEASANGGIAFVEEFRAFLDDNGFEDDPIIFGEFGEPSGEEDVEDIVEYAETFCPWLADTDNRVANKIIGWYWYGHGTNIALFDEEGDITLVGEAYIAHCGLRHKTYLPLITK